MNVIETVTSVTGDAPLVLAALVAVEKAAKAAGFPKERLPLLSMLLGCAVALALDLSVESALAGLIIGGATTGVYEAAKRR